MSFVAFSTSSTALTKSASSRPQVGHEIIFTPFFTRPLSFKIALATFISSSNSPVIETLRVSPIPYKSKAPKPIADLIVA